MTLLAKLVAGDVYLHQITIVEGSRFAELLAALRSHPAVEATDLDGPAIMTALGAPGVHPEGQFFPETYRFPYGTSDVDVLRVAHEALTSKLQAAWSNRSPDVLLKNDYEALILASIIEKETALATERRLIAGVFHERLRRNMRLQTDPTVIYGVGDAFDGNLRRQDLERDTPYNTYTRNGLPPTPIALPGAGSIEAAVSPEINGAIYFVATGRGDGSHYFSATLEEHERSRARLSSAAAFTGTVARARRIHFPRRHRRSRQVDQRRVHGGRRSVQRDTKWSRRASREAHVSAKAFATGF